jgi:hypothetical protein
VTGAIHVIVEPHALVTLPVFLESRSDSHGSIFLLLPGYPRPRYGDGKDASPVGVSAGIAPPLRMPARAVGPNALA